MFVLSLVKKHYRLQFYMVSEAPPSRPPSGCWLIMEAVVWRSGPQCLVLRWWIEHQFGGELVTTGRLQRIVLRCVKCGALQSARWAARWRHTVQQEVSMC